MRGTPLADLPHLHLLTAAGMPMNNGSVVAKPDSFFYRTDGLRPESTTCALIDSYSNNINSMGNVSTKLRNGSTAKASLWGKWVTIPFEKGKDMYIKMPAGGDSKSWESFWQGICIFHGGKVV